MGNELKDRRFEVLGGSSCAPVWSPIKFEKIKNGNRFRSFEGEQLYEWEGVTNFTAQGDAYFSERHGWNVMVQDHRTPTISFNQTLTLKSICGDPHEK